MRKFYAGLAVNVNCFEYLSEKSGNFISSECHGKFENLHILVELGNSQILCSLLPGYHIVFSNTPFRYFNFLPMCVFI